MKYYRIVVLFTGPNEASVPDFWRMIWEYKLTKIVMLTNLVEKDKVTLNLDFSSL